MKECHVCGKPYRQGDYKAHSQTLAHIRGSSASKRVAKVQRKPGGPFGWEGSK